MNGVGGVKSVKFNTRSRAILADSWDRSYDLRNWVVPDLEDKPLSLHAERLRLSLIWWSESLPHHMHPVYGPNEIMTRCLHEGPSFAEELSDAWKYGFRLFLGDWSALVPPKADSFAPVRFFEEVFPASLLIPFEMEDPEDWRLGLQYKPQSNHFPVDDFKAVVRKNLREGVTLVSPDEFDVSEFARNTKTWVSLTGRNITRTEYLHKHRSPVLTSRWEFKYSPVQKNAEEFRCSVIASPDTLFTMNLAMRQLNQINKSKIDKMGLTDTSWLPVWLSGSYTFLMVDQKKCGITFSKDLMRETLDAILEVYPKSALSYVRDALDNHTLYVNGQTFHPKRGFGLGMVNELVSFSMACLMELFFNQYPRPYQGLVFNDDQVIRVPFEESPENAYTYFLDWEMFMESAGLEVHPGKSFYAHGAGVFLEEYGHRSDFCCRKEGKFAMNILYALMAPCISVAKSYVADLSLLEGSDSEEFQSCLEFLINRVGYEFTYDEVNYPFPIGWTIHRRSGTYTLFEELLEETVYQERFINVVAVGNPPRIHEKELEPPTGKWGGPWFNGLKGQDSRLKWLRSIKRYQEKRLKAFSDTKHTSCLYTVFTNYLSTFPKNWIVDIDLNPLIKSEIQLPPRILYRIGCEWNQEEPDLALDPVRSEDTFMMYFNTHDELRKVISLARVFGMDKAIYLASMPDLDEAELRFLPPLASNPTTVGMLGKEVFLFSKQEIDDIVRPPLEGSTIEWYLAVAKFLKDNRITKSRDLIIRALWDLWIELYPELHPDNVPDPPCEEAEESDLAAQLLSDKEAANLKQYMLWMVSALGVARGDHPTAESIAAEQEQADEWLALNDAATNWDSSAVEATYEGCDSLFD